MGGKIVVDDNELPVRDFWSGFVKVQSREISNPAYFQIDDISRKVILYKFGDDVVTVADFQRQSQSLPYSVIVDVFFFVESSKSENVFVREAHGRYARNVVPWDSILGIAEGKWEGPSRWRKQASFN